MKRAAVLALLSVALVAAVALAVSVGPTPVGWGDLLRGTDPSVRTILFDVRLPRAVLAVIVGAGLAGAGVAFQALLRNPLADPYILGVSGGSALGAVLFSILGAGAYASAFGKPVAAFAGGLLTLFFLFQLARVRGRTGTTGLLLVGVILNAFYSAVILFLVTSSDPGTFQEQISFLVGNLRSLPWIVVGVAVLLVVAGLSGLLLLTQRMNLLSLGEEDAGHLGVDVERTTWAIVLAASLVTAAGVALAGLVGFVGLVVPHAVRLALGPDHRLLLPASVLAGGGFLVIADTAAQTVLAPVEIPVGVLTALVGVPLFLWLLRRSDR
jgi:iron complex transport system permease protein